VDKFVESHGKSSGNPTTFNTMMRFAPFWCNRIRDKVFEKFLSGKSVPLCSEQPFERDYAMKKCSTLFHDAVKQSFCAISGISG
jgi:hypothetical protein